MNDEKSLNEDASQKEASVAPREDQGGERSQVADGKAAYEARKQEKLQAKKEQEKTAKRGRASKKVARYAIWLFILFLAGYGFYLLLDQYRPDAEDRSVAVPSMGNEHIEVGADHEPYSSNPPTSGPHYADPARGGFRVEPIADEHIVHSLEHGLVWVSYHPRVGETVKSELRGFSGPLVIISEREANDEDIALAAWERLDAFNLEGDALSKEERSRIDDFILRYKNKGPERIPPGQHGGL